MKVYAAPRGVRELLEHLVGKKQLDSSKMRYTCGVCGQESVLTRLPKDPEGSLVVTYPCSKCSWNHRFFDINGKELYEEG